MEHGLHIQRSIRRILEAMKNYGQFCTQTLHYTGMSTIGDKIPKVYIIRTMVVLQAKGENAGQKSNKGIYRQFVATTSIACIVFR